jgi:hypothetical protein
VSDISEDAAALAAFEGLTRLIDSNPTALAKFRGVVGQLVAFEGPHLAKDTPAGAWAALLDDASHVSDFGMCCLQHVQQLDEVVLHIVMQLGSGGADGRLGTPQSRAHQLKLASQHYSSSSCLQELLQAHLTAQRAKQQHSKPDKAHSNPPDAVATVAAATSAKSSVKPLAGQQVQVITAAAAAVDISTGPCAAGQAAANSAPAEQPNIHLGAKQAMRILAGSNHGVRQQLVRWLGAAEPDEGRVLHGAKFLELLPAVVALEDAVVMRLLCVGDRRMSAAGVRLLRSVAAQHVVTGSAKS